MNVVQAISHYLNAGIDTGDDLIQKRNIIMVMSVCTMTLLLEVVVVVQLVIGHADVDQMTKVLLSTGGILIPLYLLLVKKKVALTLALLIGITLFLELLMLALYTDDVPYTHIMWAHFCTFPAVLLLGIRKSIVPVALYSVIFGYLVYIRIENSPDSHWSDVEFNQFVMLQMSILVFAYFSEWTFAKAILQLQDARAKEKRAAEEHVRHMGKMLNNKKKLLVDVSHELRTPLAVVKASIEAMEDGINKEEDTYPLLHQKVNQIDRLIQDIYLISKSDVQQLPLHIDAITMSELLEEMFSSFKQLAGAKGLTLKVNQAMAKDCAVEGDWQRLMQLFSNLLQNSMDYTDRGGQIEIVAKALPSGVEITVQDSAPGVPEEEHTQLFDRLYRKESSRSRATGGSGLGLTICKVITEAHKGTIDVSSSPLGGLAVTACLPLTQGIAD